MFRFANPEYLYLLLVLPLFLLLYVALRIRKHKDLKRYGNVELIKALMPEFSRFRLSIKYGLLTLAIGTMAFVLAGPQFGSKLETVKRQGVELMICLDVSNSMLSEDIAPSRLDKAKQMLTRLIDELNNDKIGLIVFAGEAFTQLPITSDYISAKMFLSSINPGLIPQQGTAIGAAINLAARSFTPDEASSKAIVVITDGENHEDDAIGAAKKAEEKGIKVSVIGVGSTKGAPIPVNAITNEYRKDKDGNVVITKLNEEMCQQVAQAGAGLYVRADNTNSALKSISAEVKKMSKGDVESKVYSDFDEQFQFPAWIVLILLLIEFCVLEKKNRLFRHVRLFTPKSKAVVVLLLLGCSLTLQAQKAERSNIRTGNRLYNKALNDTTGMSKDKYTDAEIAYRKALEVNQRSVPATFNLANSLVRQEKFDQAIEQYQIALTNTKDKSVVSSAFHNMGNVAMAAKQYDKAVAAYRNSLRNNPSDDETRYNLAVAQKMLQQQQQQQDQEQDKEDQQDKKEDQKEQEQPQNQQDQQQQQQDQNQQPPPQDEKDQMSKENAQQILDAFLQDEKATQEKVKKMQTQNPKKSDRDW